MEEENRYLIKSLMKSFEVLELVVKNERMSLKEINDITNLGKSTIHRILATFKEMNYIDQSKEDNTYYATIKIFELGNSVTDKMPIKKIAKPYLQRLYDECNETVNLAVVTGDNIIYLDKIMTKEPLRIDLEVGKKVPIYCSSLGKAILAYDEEYIEYLSCLAVPIKSKDGSAIASISIATPTIRLNDERKEQFIKYLKYYASCIEGELARSYIL